MKKDIDTFALHFKKNYGAQLGFVVMYCNLDANDPTVIR